MGIKDLSKVIYEKAPEAVKENDIKHMFGRKVAIDASMAIYQFLIAVRSKDGAQLTNENGETTRTIRMLENGIKPCYVFDGKPPQMKSDELAKRGVKRAEATKALETAVEAGDQENIDKFSRRTVKVTKEHNEECQKLLTLMGIPWVNAPCEAEAQCAALAKAGKVYGVGSEDMDVITFAAPVLLRHLTYSDAKKVPIQEFYHEKVLEGLGLSQDEFIDLCILLGCDYCDSIRGIGPHKAYGLIKEHKTIENILKAIDNKKYPAPENWQYQEARELFKAPDVIDPLSIDLKWTTANEEGIIEFLCTGKGFNEDRVRKGVAKLKTTKTSSTQGRMDSFFKAIPKTEEEKVKFQKRKAEEFKATKLAKAKRHSKRGK